MVFVLYAATAAVLSVAASRWVGSLSWRTAVLIAAFPLCFTGRALLTGGVYAPVDAPYETEPLHWMGPQFDMRQSHNAMLSDVFTQMIPYRQALRDAIANREWPLWNRYTLGGEVLAAAAQPAPYSPFTLLALLLPVATSFTFTAAIELFIAALSAFLFARELGCRDSAALFASAAWMYSTAVSFFIDWPIGAAWVILPFLLLAVRRTSRQPGVASSVLLLVALTLAVVAGHPESVLHLVTVGVAYGAFEMLRHRDRMLRAIVTAVAAGIITLLLCAIYLLPIMEAGPQSREYALRHDVFRYTSNGVHPHEAIARIAADFLPSLENATWTLSGVSILPPASAGVGSIVLAAAIYALWRRRTPETWFFAGLLLFGLIEHADWWPLSQWIARLPLFDIAINSYFVFAACFAFAILGAFGIEELCGRSERTGFAVTATVTLIVIGIGALLMERSGLIRTDRLLYGDYRLSADVGLLAIAVLLVIAPMRWRFVAPALVALVLIQRTVEEGGVYPTIPAVAAYPPVPLFEPLKNVRTPFRVVGQAYAFVPGTSALYGLEDVRGYAAMTLTRTYMTWPLWCIDQPVWFNRVDDLNRPFLSFLNVRYAIESTVAPLPEGWRELARYRRTRVLENTRVIPRAFVPSSIRLGADDTVAFLEMERESDFRQRAWIRSPGPVRDVTNGAGSVSIRPRRQGFNLNVSMQHDGWVIVSEPAWKGWRAYVDDKRIEHQIANIGYIGIFVPRGQHRVKLIYWPTAFVTGRGITAATIVALAAFPFAYRRRRRRLGAT